MSFSQLHLHQYLAFTEIEKHAGQYRLWVPGEKVVCHRVKMPAAARRKWTETLPWMLEDRLIDEPGKLHFCLGRADAEDEVTALSVPRGQMEQWLSLCESGSGRVVSMLPDYLALPWEEGGLSLMVEGDRWIVRCGAAEGYAGNREFITALLSAEMANQPNVSISYIGPEASMPDFVGERGRHLADSLDWSFCEYPQAFNLLHGEYRQAKSFKSLKSWWPTAAAVLLFILLASGYGVANYYRIDKEIPLLQADLSSTYRALIGSAPPTSDFRQATQRVIAFREDQYLATQGVPLSVLVELDTYLSGCSSCEIQSFSATEQGAELFMSASDNVLDRLANANDLNVDINRQDETIVKVTATPRGGNDG